MKANMGTVDRSARFVLGIIALTLAFTGTVTGWLAIVLYAVAALLVVTALVAYCPLYPLFGWDTRGASAPPAA